MKNLTSNQYYGGLNRRFDSRVRLLAKFGYKCKIFTEGGYSFGLYVRKHPNYPSKTQAITSAAIMHCDNYAWGDRLKELLIHY